MPALKPSSLFNSNRKRGARRAGGRAQYLEFLEARQLLSGTVAVQTFYMPVPAASALQALQTIHSGAKAPVSTYASISVAEDGTQIFYDQWEDGYAADIANPTAAEIYNSVTNPAGVQIWGDGDPSNGSAPGFPDDVLQAGDVIILQSPAIALPRNPSQIYFDGGDKIAATKSVAIGELDYATGTATLLAGSLQVNPTAAWGTHYTVPIGQNTAGASSMFKYTGLSIMASQDNTTVQIDTDGNGKVDKTIILNQGQSYLVNNGVKQGATVVSTDPGKPVQVNIITGNPSQTYASRWFTLAPTDQWSSSYYTPVSTKSSNATVVFLYNPSSTAISVTQTTRGNGGAAATLTSTTIKVPAKGTAKVTLAAGSGDHFYAAGGQSFYAVSTTDFGSFNYDWGMTLLSDSELTTQAIVGLGFGRDPTSMVNPGENGSPVWVTPTGNGDAPATIYVDFNGDDAGPYTDPNGYHYDLALSLKELQTAKVFDPDGDQSAMLLYTLDPAVKLAVSWGEDPASASVGSPGIDAGTNIIPLPEFDAGKSASLYTDANGDGVVSPGDTLLYTIAVNNISRTTLANLQVVDTLPTSLTYVPGTLFYTLTPHDGTPAAPVSVPDGLTTPFALGDAGLTLPMLSGGATYTITFQATIGSSLPAGLTDLINTGLVSDPSLNETVPLKSDTPVNYDITGLVFQDTNRNGALDPFEPGLTGVSVNLLRGSTIVASALTDATGHYLFIAPALGNYTVDIVDSTVQAALPNSDQTAGVDPSPVSLTGGGAFTDAGIDGYMTRISAIPSVLSGHVTLDGVGLGGVSLTLTGSNAQGAISPVTVVTAADGTYAFLGVMAGTYAISETQPAGLLDGPDFAGTFGGTVAAIPADRISNIVLPGNSIGLNYNFTELNPSSIAGFVYADINNNGVKDPGESPLGGVKLTLTGANDLGTITPIILTTATDGSYTFTNLRPGTYTLTETQPAGFLDGLDAVNGSVISGSNTTDTSGALTMTEGGSINVLFGELPPASVTGFVYADANDNGAKDAGEAPISGVKLTLTGANDLGAITPITLTSAADGSYTFGNLRPGTYTVTETQPAGYLDGLDAINGSVVPGSSATDALGGINLSAGGTTNALFGEIAPSVVSGSIFVDANNNGIKDSGEAALGGAVLTLTGASDQGPIAPLTVTSAANGTYSFGNLRPGTYTVTETQPAGYLDGKDSKAGVVIPASNTTDVISGLSFNPGANATGNNFGELLAGSVAGFVYSDVNNNGVKNGGDAPISGVLLTLTGTNDLGTIAPMTAASAADGSYNFGTLRPGTYTVTETQPVAYLDGLDAKAGVVIPASNTTDAITALTTSSGTTLVNNNFGELLAGVTSGTVFLDANNNGLQDSGETPIGGVTLTLSGGNDLGVITPVNLTTAADGTYSFGNLRPGTYTITETQPAGYLDGKDAKAGVVLAGSSITDTITGLNVGVGGSAPGNTFGELLPSTVSGLVFADLNDDGLKGAGESPISGVQLTLSGSDDLGAITSITATTAADGSYNFGNLRPGTYAVTETQPAGYLDGLDARNGVVIPGSNTSDAVGGLTLASGGNANVTFGELPVGGVSGYVYADANNNGLKDAGEAALSGVKLTLTGVNDLGTITPISLTTAADGSYSFGTLRPGTYTVTETQPAGYLDGLDAKGGVVIPGSNTSDAITGISIGVAGSAGDNFGELLPASVNGSVFVDANNNGLKDSGEAPLPGVKLTLTGSNDLGPITPLTVTTAADGSYSFGTLRPGTYTVTETQPAGYLDGKDAKAGVVIANSNTTDTIAGIAVGTGANAAGNTFGELQAGTLSGYSYVDGNNNGLKDSGEAPVSGVHITLTGADGLGAIAPVTVTTAADGSYSFGNLRPGTYTITETQPAGYLDGKDTVGSLGGTLGNDVISAVGVASGAAGTGYNFGEQITASISGQKFQDLTGDGASPDDTPLGGVKINLYRDDGDHVRDSGDVLVMSTTTASGTGDYSFSNLPKAYYFVEEVVPAGWVRTGPTNVDYYAADLTGSTSTITGDNFTNFQVRPCQCNISGIYYIINGCNTVSTLAGNIHQGDTVRAIFTLKDTDTLSLVSYTAPDPTFVADHSMQQVIFDSNTATYAAGTHSLTVVVPNSYFQIDFVCGTPLTVLGPAGSNIYYTPQGRLIDSDNGGTTPPKALGTPSGTGSIAGSVYIDSNNNAKKDSTEAGIAGVKVTLTGVTTGGVNIKITLMTDASGNFKFTNLQAGTYKISEGSLDSHHDGKDTAGTKGGNVTNDVISSIVLTNGVSATGYLFGEA